MNPNKDGKENWLGKLDYVVESTLHYQLIRGKETLQGNMTAGYQKRNEQKLQDCTWRVDLGDESCTLSGKGRVLVGQAHAL